MIKFLDKFKVKVPSTQANEEELKTIKGFITKNSAWVDTVNQALQIAAKARNALKIESEEFWKTIVLKYNLDSEKIFSIDQKSGEIIEVPKEIKKGGEK